MPRRDGTGPAGKGPMTGGRRGNCGGPNQKPCPLPRDGRGEGKGRRRQA